MPASVGNAGSDPGLGRSPGEVHGSPLWYSCLSKPMHKEPGGLQSRGVTESQTRLSS